jgi:hypothetical protein
MANDKSHNSSNVDNNDDENPSSMLEQLLIVQAQLLQTMQEILVQMQGVNQLMHSMEERSSSRKRKSNTQDDDVQAHKINAIEKKQHPTTKKVLRQLKQPQCVSSVHRLVIMPIDVLNHVRVPPLHLTPTYLKLLRMRTKSKETKSVINVMRGVTMLFNAPTRKPKKRREYIQKIKDGYDLDLDDYYVEDWFTKDGSRDLSQIS